MPVDLFTPATDPALNCDAYLIDTSRTVRPLNLEPLVPAATVVEALLERLVLMGRSLYDVAEHTFALFFTRRGSELVIAPTEPYHEGVIRTLLAVLGEFGEVATGSDIRVDETEFEPLLAYERGKVSFFIGPRTAEWRPLAGNRGLRILSATLAHDPGGEIDLPEVTS